MRPKSRNFLGAARQGKEPQRRRKKAEKGALFQRKNAISGHGDIQTIKTGWEVLP